MKVFSVFRRKNITFERKKKFKYSPHFGRSGNIFAFSADDSANTFPSHTSFFKKTQNSAYLIMDISQWRH